MNRSLRAQLSPNEEAALLKIAAGGDVDEIPLDHLKRLAALWLAESRDGKWELTEFGAMRVAARRP